MTSLAIYLFKIYLFFYFLRGATESKDLHYLRKAQFIHQQVFKWEAKTTCPFHHSRGGGDRQLGPPAQFGITKGIRGVNGQEVSS